MRASLSEPSSAPTSAPLPCFVNRTPRWDLGAFVLVELVYLLASMSFVVLFVGDGPLSAWMLALAVGAPTVIAGRAQESESLFGHGFGVIEIACADATQPVRSASEPIDSNATDADPCHFRCWRDRLAAVLG